MNKTDLISMALESGFDVSMTKSSTVVVEGVDCTDELIEFAKAVARAERERCCLTVYDATDFMHEERDFVTKEIICEAIRALSD